MKTPQEQTEVSANDAFLFFEFWRIVLKTLAQTLSHLKKAVILAVCMGSVAVAQAQEVKIGLVDSGRIMRESAPAKAAEAKIEGEFSKRKKDLLDLSARLKSMAEKLDKDMPVLTESDRIKRQRELADLDQEFQRKQRAFREDLNQRRNEEIASVVDKVSRAIKRIAQTENYDLVLQDAVYISPRIDITEKVLQALNAGK